MLEKTYKYMYEYDLYKIYTRCFVTLIFSRTKKNERVIYVIQNAGQKLLSGQQDWVVKICDSIHV